MKPLKNPFITSGYESAEYFCDREQESENLIREVTNGNNLALISTRRMGKTGLIQHLSLIHISKNKSRSRKRSPHRNMSNTSTATA